MRFRVAFAKGGAARIRRFSALQQGQVCTVRHGKTSGLPLLRSKAWRDMLSRPAGSGAGSAHTEQQTKAGTEMFETALAGALPFPDIDPVLVEIGPLAIR